MDEEHFLCDLTKEFWKYYLLEPSEEHFAEMLKFLSEDAVIIGTGKNEIYSSMAVVIEQMTKNFQEATTISFHILDEWYQPLKISDDVYVVYGGLWAKEDEKANAEISINMDTRFSFIYRRLENKWKLYHVHHSTPYYDQQNDEFYPKTLSKMVQETRELAERYRLNSELDLMTGIYHNQAFKYYAQNLLNTYPAVICYMIDFDFFKQINDTYGHMMGDKFLKTFSEILKASFISDHAVVGRIGGDEFAIVQSIDDEFDEKQIYELEKAYLSAISQLVKEDKYLSFSFGASKTTEKGMPIGELLKKADEELYVNKRKRQKNHEVQ